MANEYLKYTSRDYNSIYTDIVNAIPAITDLWTNTEDSDPGIVLVKLMSALGDMLSYNMDKQALEYYASTVTQRKNATKLFNLIGYHMHWYMSATNQINVTNTLIVPNKYKGVPAYIEAKQIELIPSEYWTPEQRTTHDTDVTIYTSCANDFKNSHPKESYPEYYDGDEIDTGYLYTNNNSEMKQGYDNWVTDNTLNIYTYIASPTKTMDVRGTGNNDITYIIKPTIESSVDSTGNYLNPTDTIKPGETHSYDVIQGSLNSVAFNSSKLRENRYYLVDSAIDENNIWLGYTSTDTGNTPSSMAFINRVDNLLTITDGDLHFEFGIDEFDIPYIELSSYWGDLLGDSVNFTLYYIRTQGVYGNITKDFLTTIEGLPRNSYTITHPANNVPYIDSLGNLIAIPGYHPQTAHQAYIDSINYNTTFNTLVTIYDFERFCKRQKGISNTYAVDKQRAKDINTALEAECENLSYAQLLAYYKEATGNTNEEPIDNIKAMYMDRKSVRYNDLDYDENYKPYYLNLHVVCGNFDTALSYTNNIPDTDSIIASLNNNENKFWIYKINNNYTIEYVTDEHGEYVRDNEGKKIIKHHEYSSIEDVTGDGRIAHYLDEKLRTTKIVNVLPEYAAVRVFPWRCCGTIHLKNPVTQDVANRILEAVMEHLRATFHPANLEFGKKINYMDVINAVTESHDMIRYFDAGLDSRKLIDIDKSCNMSYFNNTSLMYYVQTSNGYELSPGQFIEGNDEPYMHGSTTANPYYKILSIATEYIIK